MAKRLIALLMAVGILCSLQLTAFATGFEEYGGYSDTKMSFGFETQDAVLVFNKEAEEDPNLSEVLAGSQLYIPIGVFDEDTGEFDIATDKQIKDYSVSVSYKANSGSQYIDDVTIVNGKKAKMSEIGSGAHARIDFSSNYPNTRYANIDLMLVLSVNKKSCQETRVNLVTSLVNPSDEIDNKSVYSVRGPSQFEVGSNYNGEVSFDFGDKIIYTARVTKRAKYYLNLDRSEDEAVKAMDSSAHMEFYNFLGDRDTFASVGKLDIPIDKDKFSDSNKKVQIYGYEIINGRLSSMGTDVLSYDSRESVLSLRTQTLGNYVLSNQALLEEIESASGDSVIKTGYATLEELVEQTGAEESSVAPAQTGTQQSTQSQSAATGQNQTANPDTGTQEAAEEAVESEARNEAEDAGATRENSADTRATYTYSTAGQPTYADNPSGFNPPTGNGGHMAAVMMATAALFIAVSAVKNE